MSQKNLALTVVAVVLTLAAVGVFAAYLSQPAPAQDTIVEENDTPTPPPVAEENTRDSIVVGEMATMEFDDESITLAQNASTDVNVAIRNLGVSIRSAEMVIKFDPTLLKVNSVEGTSDFDLYVGDTIDEVNGLVRISGATSGDNLVEIDAGFATLNITRIAEGDATLEVVSIDTAGTDQPFSSFVNSAQTQYSFMEKTLTIR